MKLVTQAELAKVLKVSKPYISKLAKKGIFDNCFEGKKLKLDCAKKAYEENRKIFVRETKLEKAKKEVIKKTPVEIKQDKKVFNKKNIDELAELLLDVEKPALKVQIIKEYWAGKLNELKFLKEKGKLIDRYEVERQLHEAGVLIAEDIMNFSDKNAYKLVNKNEDEIRNILKEDLRQLANEISEKLKIKSKSEI